MSRQERIIDFLQEHPNSSVMEIARGCGIDGGDAWLVLAHHDTPGCPIIATQSPPQGKWLFALPTVRSYEADGTPHDEVLRTNSGMVVTEEDIQRWADEAEEGYDI